MTSKCIQLVLLAIVAGSALSAKITGSFEKGVPDSGYGCANECNDADVNYVIRASLETYTIKGANNAPGFPDGEKVKTFTRTFEGVKSESSPFCNDGDDGTTGPLAPCLTVNPGQTLKIKIINDMENGMTLLKQNMTQMAILQSYAKQTNVAIVNGTGLGGTGLNNISEGNMPGYDETFDIVNLHLHGLQVIPHLFYPQGTGDPSADWITITPPNENTTTQCFCYVFDIPDDHPMGTFFWHIHRHGSTAMQSWAGMAGMVQVGNSSTPGSPESELEAQGVTRRHPMVLWEWAIDTRNVVSDGDSNNTYFEGAFPVDFDVPTRQITMLNNNEYQPTLEMKVNETIHVPLLCAQMTTGSVLYILNENDENVKFWVFASDGISYSSGKAYEKSMMVVGPGQREGLLLQFDSPGTYRVMQYLINNLFNIDNETSVPTAFIHVVTETSGVIIKPVDITSLQFTAGMNISETIEDSEIESNKTVTFGVGMAMTEEAPFPRFTIDNKLFNVSEITHTVNASSASAWKLTSTLGFHPFHIHVNPFQVKEVYIDAATLRNETIDFTQAVLDTATAPQDVWRDTIFIPDGGFTRIYQRFGGGEIAWTGKTVFHCHFLDHEDQGMISAIMIGDPNFVATDIQQADSPTGSSSARSNGMALAPAFTLSTLLYMFMM